MVPRDSFRLDRGTLHRFLADLRPLRRALRAGTAQSVLDLNCKAHEVDNLHVTDASFFPSIGAVNPTLTIIANALRVGDEIAARLR